MSKGESERAAKILQQMINKKGVNEEDRQWALRYALVQVSKKSPTKEEAQ